MKIKYLFFLLLLQSCLYQAPVANRQYPADTDLKNNPTEVLVIKYYYYPSPVLNEVHIPINEVVIDHHPEDIGHSAEDEFIPEENTTLNIPIIETTPVVQEIIVLEEKNNEKTYQAPIHTVQNPNTINPVIMPTQPIVTVVIESPAVEWDTISEEETLPANPVVHQVVNQPVIQTPTVIDGMQYPIPAPNTSPAQETINNQPPVSTTPPPEIVINHPEPEESPIVSEVFPVIPLVASNLIPNETRQIVSLFVFYASLFNRNVEYSKLIIEIEDKPSSFYIAYCSKVNNNQNPKIKMNRQFWSALNSSYREMLLFHEMGHCLLNRSHQGNDFYNPSSIMNSSLFSEVYYRNNYDFFIRELFGFSYDKEEPILFGAMYEHIH
jgi:hypothetical protein